MNTARLKAFAPKARRDLIRAVTDRAHKLGLTKKGASEIAIQGDTAVIEGHPYPRTIGVIREELRKRIAEQGFDRVIDAAAYSWFNRLMALRFMEVHGYLDHGFCVLSDPADPENPNAMPQILREAENVELPGVARERVIELKLDGNKDAELYALLLKGQCRALHEAMPFLFEAIDDDTELLLPENLLHSGSIVRGLVNEIDETDWQSIEIVGWLYQFYISEKKDEVIGKVVKPDDVPAATQLFTPNWIVKYMVQNSLGARWLATYPQSLLKGQMEYFIEPAEQTSEVKAALEATTPNELNPEELTVIDPACGSGHILVEAYDLFKAIYTERGYRQRDIPQLILGKNLYGLDIDQRAAQLTAFALMMKGRADNQRIFSLGATLNVMAVADSAGLNSEALSEGVELSNYGLQPKDITDLKRLFEQATTFGSLIQVPDGLANKLTALKQLCDATSQNLFVSEALKRLRPLVQQAGLLAAKYDAVVANPPYMGSKGMNDELKRLARDCFPDAKSDLFACFIERGYALAKEDGHNAMVTMQSWMFLSSFQSMRERTLREKTIASMAQIGFNSFPSMNSKIAQATVFSIMNRRFPGFLSTFIDLNSAPPSADKQAVFLARHPDNRFTVAAEEFAKIPGSPLAFWVTAPMKMVFAKCPELASLGEVRRGLQPGDTPRNVRSWQEVSLENTAFAISPDEVEVVTRKIRWVGFTSGGPFRKWAGNLFYVVNWHLSGFDIKHGHNPIVPNEHLYFREAITWSKISSGAPSFRLHPAGLIPGDLSPFVVTSEQEKRDVFASLNSVVTFGALQILSPTITFPTGTVGHVPILRERKAASNVDRLVAIAESDWNAYEQSWNFECLPILSFPGTLEESYTAWISKNRLTIAEMKRLEEENNRQFIDAYNLGDELTANVPIEQITLTVNPAYRYGPDVSEKDQWIRFREDTAQELVSFAIGCMMGRYSLDQPGLIYANSGNKGFDPTRYTKLPADDDGIIPVTDNPWFDDDAANRLFHFISVVWDKEHLQENLKFLADSLSPKKGEAPRETIRRYLCTKFFKDHLQTYKRRPIYWLFSSGKEKAFEALVYLHRYSAGTLARMRTEYVIPLAGKLKARIAHLKQEEDAESSTAQKRKLAKERATMEKKDLELTKFDELLKHYADQRIELDLDDGVRLNYGRFGDLLAEVKAVCGSEDA